MTIPKLVQTAIDDRLLVIEAGRFAGQADGAVTIRYGDTVVLVTVCVSAEPREGIDFIPLTVDYEERLYAAGKIPGGYFKREGRPSQDAVLADRLTDRPIRPLLPKNLHHDVQIVVTVLSTDQENDPDILSVIGASAALTISSIPFDGPVGAVRMGYADGRFLINPTFTQLLNSDLDLVVASTRDQVIMVEAGAKQIKESLMLEALRLAHEANQESIKIQQELALTCGKPKMELPSDEMSPEVRAAVVSILNNRLVQAIAEQNKATREEMLAGLRQELREKLGETYPASQLLAALEMELKAEIRRGALERGVRPGGRTLTEIRPISCEVGNLPCTHGSGIFNRGQTQVLTIATLGSPREGQRLDGISQEESKRFMHHYNMPPFSNGEVRRIGTPSRREIGHGALAERALLPVIPEAGSFPYTIRLVSEVLSSNGSTSMASVCGSTLSLMDAGVPIKAPVAGVAMGLITREDGKYAILTDIEGLEDAYGDMDFKVAGTAEGITALQMDVKNRGISLQIVEQTLSRAREARLAILEKMKQTIAASRSELSKYAPRMYKMTIDRDKIRNVIGPGGKIIRSIIEETKVSIEVEDDGTVIIGSPSEEAAQKAIKMVEDLTRDVEVGAIYTGKVTRVTNFGAFVEILPGKEGLVHLSELADYPAPSVAEVVSVGDEIMVIVTEIDRLGRINLSRRAVLEKAAGVPGAKPQAAAPSAAPSAAPRSRPPAPGYQAQSRQAQPRRAHRDDGNYGGERRSPGGERPGGTGSPRPSDRR